MRSLVLNTGAENGNPRKPARRIPYSPDAVPQDSRTVGQNRQVGPLGEATERLCELRASLSSLPEVCRQLRIEVDRTRRG